jgi:hypothetical protein|tara:strand:- start:267 stop:545 length:279 start_codon:yes stop_codon:yes gene_type:complete
MTVKEMMERAGVNSTGLALAWIKDAVHTIKSSHGEELKVNKQNIIDGEREYVLPLDMVAVKSISVKDTSDSKYKKIKRLVFDPTVTEDTDPE